MTKLMWQQKGRLKKWILDAHNEVYSKKAEVNNHLLLVKLLGGILIETVQTGSHNVLFSW